MAWWRTPTTRSRPTRPASSARRTCASLTVASAMPIISAISLTDLDRPRTSVPGRTSHHRKESARRWWRSEVSWCPCCLLTRPPYRALCSGGLSLTPKMCSLCTAACVHVHASSIRACLSFSVFDWRAQRIASSAYSRNWSAFDIDPSRFRVGLSCGVCAHWRQPSV